MPSLDFTGTWLGGGAEGGGPFIKGGILSGPPGQNGGGPDLVSPGASGLYGSWWKSKIITFNVHVRVTKVKLKWWNVFT